MKRYHQGMFQRYVLLNMIHTFGPISRTQLAERSGFRLATVGEIAKTLIQEGLIQETGLAAEGMGRRRIMLEMNYKRICAVGISISRTEISAVLARLDGAIAGEASCPREAGEPCEALVERIGECVGSLLWDAGDALVTGIGIGDPLYDPASYRKGDSIVSNYGHFNDWVHLKLKPALEARFGLPVQTLSAVTLPALVEYHYGVAKGMDNFICVELSNGIGSSLFFNGMAISGARGVAGELGHTVVDINEHTLCYCGKPGCVELGASFLELTRSLATAIERGADSCLRPDDLSVDAIRRALEAGDATCRFCVDRAAWQAGTAIANAVNLLNPELIVLYGFMLELGDYYLDRLTEAIRSHTLALSSGYRICTSLALESKIPLGAAAEVFIKYLHSDEFRWVDSILEEEEQT